ncbi:hypothetical protein Hanom_Chr04g00359821 [Helianthus anomalus]
MNFRPNPLKNPKTYIRNLNPLLLFFWKKKTLADTLFLSQFSGHRSGFPAGFPKVLSETPATNRDTRRCRRHPLYHVTWFRYILYLPFNLYFSIYFFLINFHTMNCRNHVFNALAVTGRHRRSHEVAETSEHDAEYLFRFG